jgi:hypothetical protein
MDHAVCLNCGVLIEHEPDAHIVMRFRPGIGKIPVYVVEVDGVEVHRCTGTPQNPSLGHASSAEPSAATTVDQSPESTHLHEHRC